MKILPETLALLGYISADEYLSLTDEQDQVKNWSEEAKKQQSERMREVWAKRRSAAP